MTSEWKTRILELRYRSTETEDLEFVSLVDMAENNCDFDTCRILMKTFVTEEDFGVQESVNSVLSTANPEDRQKALLEELPRLIVDTPGWTNVLIETEIRFYLDSFRATVKGIQPHLRETLNQLLSGDSFQKHFPNLRI
jgi:hypothetical protein